jgi:hypothetical protein
MEIGITLYLLIEFVIFILLQGVAINGIYECCQEDKIFYLIAPGFFKVNKGKKWAKPLWGCVMCMASFWGSITFWGTVLLVYGFYPIEIWIWIWDVFILTIINVQIYKRA